MNRSNVFLTAVFISCITLVMACNSNTKTNQITATVLDSSTMANKKFAIAYQNDNKIVASSIDTLKQISFGSATYPAISPNGNKLAYTVTDSAGHKTIWVADMENKSQMQLKLNNDNYDQAMWSPSGNAIAFNIFTSSKIWKIGLIKADNTGFIILNNSFKINTYSPTWKNENEITAHDLINLYTFDVSGKIINTQKLQKLIGAEFLISSSNRFFFTKEEKKLVFNAFTVNKLNDSVEAVYVLDLETHKVDKISPKGMNVPYVFVTADDRIFYSGFEKVDGLSKIYISDLMGNIKMVVDKGTNPTGTMQ